MSNDKNLTFSNNKILGKKENSSNFAEESYKNIPKVSEKGVKESEGKLFYELDFEFITQMAKRMAVSKANGKYPRWNWKKDIDVEELTMAIFRHTLAIMEGDYKDDGRNFGHLEALATNAMMISYQLKQK